MTRQLRLPAFVVACLVAGALAVQCLAMIGTALADEPTVVLDAGPAIAPGNAPATGEDPKADAGTPPAMPADPIASPTETWTFLRYVYSLGWLPFGLAALCVLAALAVAKWRPADVTGDGLPDPERTAKGYTWIAASALVVVLPPLALRLGDVDGFSWAVVFNAVGVAAVLAWGLVQRLRKPAKAVG